MQPCLTCIHEPLWIEVHQPSTGITHVGTCRYPENHNIPFCYRLNLPLGGHINRIGDRVLLGSKQDKIVKITNDKDGTIIYTYSGKDIDIICPAYDDKIRQIAAKNKIHGE